MRSLMALFGLAVLCGGCQELYHVPGHGPHERAVFDSARRVMLQRYPLARPVEKSGMILVLTPVEMEGTYPSRKKITVQVTRNFVGVWEPRVRVEKHVEIGEPLLTSDIDSDLIGRADPAVIRNWKPLMYLPLEEQAITDEILSDLRSAGGRKT